MDPTLILPKPTTEVAAVLALIIVAILVLGSTVS